MTEYPGTKVVNEDSNVDFHASCSGLYDTDKLSNEYRLEIKIDVDRPNAFQRSVDFVSGTVKTKAKTMWSGRSTAAYFRSQKGCVEIRHDNDLIIVNAPIHVTLSDGGSREGDVCVTCRRSRGKFYCDVRIHIESTSVTFKNVPRLSTHFRDVTIDIDYVTERHWPIIELKNYKGLPEKYRIRKLDLFSVFEDAGLKLHYDPNNSEKVEDPTKNTPWSKGDMFELMKDYFDEEVVKDVDQSIWCLMANKPPDPRYMGYSFDYEGKKGFGLFADHTSFDGMKSSCPKVRAQATRRFLHYLAHECGHTLGLVHPFEEGNINSLSWMNYAWKYNESNGEGMFYKNFRYNFSDNELIILRHQPDNLFKNTYKKESGTDYQYSSGPKSVAPSTGDSDDEEEDNQQKVTPGRKLKFDIKVRPQPYSKGDIVEFEATLKNVGKLPCKIEPGLVPGEGNLNVYVTNPLGQIKIVKPFAGGIDAPTRKYLILGIAGSSVNPDTYSEVVPLIQCSNGGLFEKIGTYKIEASYEGAGLRATSKSVNVVVGEDTDDDDDDITKTDVRISAELEGNVCETRKRVVEYWDKQVKKPAEIKAKRIQALLRLLKGLSKSSVKLIAAGRATRKKRKGKKVSSVPGYKTPEQLCKDTADLVEYFHSNYGNTPAENQSYASLILERSILLKENDLGQAQIEFNQLVADLIDRNAKYDFVKSVAKKWKEIALPKTQSREELLKSYQERVSNIMYWTPKEKVELGTEEQSGIGLGMPFNTFDDDHRGKVSKFVEQLQSIEEDTNDFGAVLDYIEAKQQSMEVNYLLFQFTFECYLVHSKLAKKLHITYPNPLKMDREYLTNAAIVTTVRKGTPQEVWMNYWRCNGEFNHHHRHWHAIYGGGFDFAQTKRQGELFGYMHAQLLARYDAERESWGLDTVRPYEYDEVEPDGFNAGLEFHTAFTNFAPRPPNQRWDENLARSIKGNEESVLEAFQRGTLPRTGAQTEDPAITSNLAGHIIEASSRQYQRYYGSMHNSGHMAFVRLAGIPRWLTSYMGSTVTAVRDPIFFRWHKRVDNLFQFWNNKVLTEIAEDAPGVIVESSDVIIAGGRKQPDGFKDWTGSNWKNTGFKSDNIKTTLVPLDKDSFQFEWDNRLEHDQFTYHIRVRRKPNVQGDIAMTIRLFICQERHVNNRRKWIEMDKFVHVMKSDNDHIVVERKDIEASVIKRTHDASADSTELKNSFTESVEGNCECGWPYDMMLPRGERDGENWVLSCIISDNTLDMITRTAACGSMSYCGTMDQVYPDKRTMGYPFSTPITLNGNLATITEAEANLTNFTFSKFVIQNDYDFQKPGPPVRPPTPTQPVVVWAPFSISPPDGRGIYSSSRITDRRIRVLLDDTDFRGMGTNRIRLTFKSRSDGESYSIYNVKMALRSENTLNVDSRFNVQVLFNGQDTARVDPTRPQTVSDEIVLAVKPAPGRDYFVTFTLRNAGCYLYSSDLTRYNSYFVNQNNIEAATSDDNWEDKGYVGRRFRSLYCIESALSFE